MATLDEKTMDVVAAFQRWAKGSDSDEIGGFSLDDLKTAELKLGGRDTAAPYRLALQRRISELEAAVERQSQSRIRALGYIVTFVLGVLSAIGAELILRM